MADHFTIDAPGKASGNPGSERRSDPADAVPRVFRLGGEWYFTTREGDIGPFRTREQAKREAHAHQTVLKPG